MIPAFSLCFSFFCPLLDSLPNKQTKEPAFLVLIKRNNFTLRQKVLTTTYFTQDFYKQQYNNQARKQEEITSFEDTFSSIIPITSLSIN
jgi:hypothetical protein